MTVTEDISTALEAVRQSGGLTPTRVLRIAKKPESILHPLFEWDDSKAGHEYRLGQARRLIATRVVREPGAERAIRAYIHVPSKYGEGEYLPVALVVQNEDKLALARDAALRDLRAARDNLDELDEAVRLYGGSPDQGRRARRASKAVGIAEAQLAGV